VSQTALAFLLLYTAGLISALAIRPIYGLYTYIAIFYLDPPSRWWGAALPDLRWSLTASAVTLIALYIHRDKLSAGRQWHRPTIIRVFLIYVLWMWLQWPWAGSPEHGEGVILFTKYAVLIYLMYKLVDNQRDFYGFCLVHVLGCAYFGWLVYMAPSGGRLEGVGGPGVNDANTLGMHLASGLMFASFLMLASKGRIRWFILATIPLILNGIVQTETRGAVVGLFLGGLATLYLKPRAYRRTYYALACLGMLAFVTVANEAFIARMHTLTAATDEQVEWDNSAVSRIAIVKAQLRMFADHPLGAGHQGTAFLSRQYLDERWLASETGDRASHNTIMSVLVDQGLPGIVLISILIISAWRTLKRLKRMDRSGLDGNLALYRTMLGGSLVTILGAGMFAQYLKAEVWIWNIVLLVVLAELAERAVAAVPENVAETMYPPRGILPQDRLKGQGGRGRTPVRD
jgi:hypothetical protein